MGGEGQSPAAGAGPQKWSSSWWTAHPRKEGHRKFSAGRVTGRSANQRQKQRLCSERSRRPTNLRQACSCCSGILHQDLKEYASAAFSLSGGSFSPEANVTFGCEPSQIGSLHVSPDDGAVLQHAASVMSLALLVHRTVQRANRPPWHAFKKATCLRVGNDAGVWGSSPARGINCA